MQTIKNLFGSLLLDNPLRGRKNGSGGSRARASNTNIIKGTAFFVSIALLMPSTAVACTIIKDWMLDLAPGDVVVLENPQFEQAPPRIDIILGSLSTILIKILWVAEFTLQPGEKFTWGLGKGFPFADEEVFRNVSQDTQDFHLRYRINEQDAEIVGREMEPASSIVIPPIIVDIPGACPWCSIDMPSLPYNLLKEVTNFTEDPQEWEMIATVTQTFPFGTEHIVNVFPNGGEGRLKKEIMIENIGPDDAVVELREIITLAISEPAPILIIGWGLAFLYPLVFRRVNVIQD